MAEYPEHAKLMAVKDESQAIGEFLDYTLPRAGITLCESSEAGRFWPTHKSIQTLLAYHFDIDPAALEDEKRQMLDEIRATNARPANSEVDPERSR